MFDQPDLSESCLECLGSEACLLSGGYVVSEFREAVACEDVCQEEGLRGRRVGRGEQS